MYRKDLPKIEITFAKPTYGYFDGARTGGVFTIENIGGILPSYIDEIEHPGPDIYINWGCFSLNFWFHTKSGRSWKEAAAIAKRRLEHIVAKTTTVEIFYEADPQPVSASFVYETTYDLQGEE